MEISNRMHSRSTLNLAMAIHFNIYFSFTYAFLVGGLVIEKQKRYIYQDDLQKFALVPVFSLWAFVESPRLYLGQYGNLTENVPRLAAFLLLSLFPQFAIVIYLGVYQELIFPCDKTMCGIASTFLISELVFGGTAMRHFIRCKTARFYRDNNCRDQQQEDYLKQTVTTAHHQQQDLEVRYWSRKMKKGDDEEEFILSTITDENNKEYEPSERLTLSHKKYNETNSSTPKKENDATLECKKQR